MGELEKLVAVISPWEKLPDLVKRKFRVESLPEEKKVMVWREDLQDRDALLAELATVGITAVETRSKKVTARWQDVQ
jgi:hypothetical protein